MKKLLIAAVVLMYGGCVDYTEELWFNPDLSGRIQVNITIEEKLVKLIEETNRRDNIFTEEGINNRFERVEGIRIIEAKVYTDGENRLSSFTLAFDSIESLMRISNAKKETNFLGEISITKTVSGTYVFDRIVVMSNDAQQKVIDEVMDQYTWVYRVHLPGKVLEVNKSINSFDRDKGSLTWVYSLKELTKNPQVMRAIYEAPEPVDYSALIFACAVFLLMFGGLFYILRKHF